MVRISRYAFPAIATAFYLLVFASNAFAQSSLGIGANEASLPASGLFSGWLVWITARQSEFYQLLTGALKSMRDGGGGLWVLIGLSFAYGIFHAAGPGHGKAVISSYMLANEIALRRGIVLSFASALLQAATAILLMAAIFLMLRGTAISMTDATAFLQTASYALVAAFGAWLLWRKAGRPLRARLVGHPAASLSSAHVHETDSNRQNHHHSQHDHSHGEVCATCGHSHAPDPAMLGGDRFEWRTAWAAVVAVGVRPCTGALIALSFAFLHGLWAGGVISVIAMAIGTAITVSLLATLAVTAKNWAVAFAGDGRTGNRIHAAIEIAGAGAVFLLGVTLLTANLSA